MSLNDAPLIAPGNLNVMGNTVEVFADVRPDEYPDGLEVILMKPGQLEPIARVLVNKGCMIGAIPPAMADALRGQMRAPEGGGGKVLAPGVRG